MDDTEGADLQRLADDTATATVLEGCLALRSLPLVAELAPDATEAASARVLQRLMECTLELAFKAREETPKDVQAGDAIAAGAIMGLVSTSPGQPFPKPGTFKVVKGAKESRLNLATQWTGSSGVNNARGMRDYEETCLSAFRHYLHNVVDNGELRRRYREAFPPIADAATARQSVQDSPDKPSEAMTSQKCAPSADTKADGATTGRGRASWRLGIAVGLVGFVTVLALVAITVWQRHPQPTIGVVVNTNRDKLVLDPKLFADAGGSYVTDEPIERVSAPPGLRDSCDGRWAWAHSAALQSVDADATVARVDLTPSSHSVTVVGAEVHYDNDQTPAIAGTYLTCPGVGGNIPPDTLVIDLDSGNITFYPSGGDEPASLNLQIAKGSTEALIVDGNTLDRFCRWRLELAINDGSGVRALTIGSSGYAFGSEASHPEVKSFETTGSLASKPYRFLGGEWKLGR